MQPVVIVAIIVLTFSRALGQLVVLVGHFDKQGFCLGIKHQDANCAQIQFPKALCPAP